MASWRSPLRSGSSTDYLWRSRPTRGALFFDAAAGGGGRRCKVTPLHISIAHGTGRGWIVELMSKLLGQWNCTKTKMSTLCGEGDGGAFQDYLDKSLFCLSKT